MCNSTLVDEGLQESWCPKPGKVPKTRHMAAQADENPRHLTGAKLLDLMKSEEFVGKPPAYVAVKIFPRSTLRISNLTEPRKLLTMDDPWGRMAGQNQWFPKMSDLPSMSFKKLRRRARPPVSRIPVYGRHQIKKLLQRIKAQHAYGRRIEPVRRIDRTVVQAFFKLLRDNKIEEIDRRLLFNFDETMLSPKQMNRYKVISFGNKRRPTSDDLAKTPHCTVIAVTSAAGGMLRPHLTFSNIIYLPEKLPEPVAELFDFSSTASGWTDTALLHEYFERTFIPHVQAVRAKIGTDKRAMLICDGASTHRGLKELLAPAGIDVICLPPHSSTVLQPLDLAVFGAFKGKALHLLKTMKLAECKTVTERDNLLLVCHDAWLAAKGTLTNLNGWAKSGISPFDPEAPLRNPCVVSRSLPSPPVVVSKRGPQTRIRGKVLTPTPEVVTLPDSSNSDSPDSNPPWDASWCPPPSWMPPPSWVPPKEWCPPPSWIPPADWLPPVGWTHPHFRPLNVAAVPHSGHSPADARARPVDGPTSVAATLSQCQNHTFGNGASIAGWTGFCWAKTCERVN
ncbi:hypothetical protein PAPYR_4110 [Paratrimastix pyriformis]|uniref:DDE-1 domain-containing protein n=1 Tax=Paratrimastix pyriformis TaxID=342808 RepID=A0ABQ8UNX0_9EUKA|nr:hypothetical protein PAPYR_4110 [Paratrimastix pyriformis]